MATTRETLSARVQALLTPDEKAALERAAAKADRPLSAWMRRVLMEHITPRSEPAASGPNA